MNDILVLFLVFVAGASLPVLAIGLSTILTRRVHKYRDLNPYECGILPEGDTRVRYSIRFYVIALLFLIFDVEVVFLYPYAVQVEDLGKAGFLEVWIFLGILILGFAYVWRKGGLNWDISFWIKPEDETKNLNEEK